MKNFLTIVLMLTLLMGLGLRQAWGQDAESFPEPPQYDVFASLMFEYATIDHMPMQSRGLGAALLFNGHTFLGFYGTALSERSQLSPREGHIRHSLQGVSFDQMGLWMGYIHRPEKRLHMMFSTQLGTGGISYEMKQEAVTRTAQVFVLNPQIAMELNLTRWLRLNAGMGYRWLSDSYEEGFENINLGKLSTHIQLRLGGFNR